MDSLSKNRTDDRRRASEFVAIFRNRTVRLVCHTVSSSLSDKLTMRRQERVGKAEICNFPTEKISVLKILIMSLNY